MITYQKERVKLIKHKGKFAHWQVSRVKFLGITIFKFMKEHQ